MQKSYRKAVLLEVNTSGKQMKAAQFTFKAVNEKLR